MAPTSAAERALVIPPLPRKFSINQHHWNMIIRQDQQSNIGADGDVRTAYGQDALSNRAIEPNGGAIYPLFPPTSHGRSTARGLRDHVIAFRHFARFRAGLGNGSEKGLWARAPRSARSAPWP